VIVCVVRMVGAQATVDSRLLSACLGDRDQADRLIALEMRRIGLPGRSRSGRSVNRIGDAP
jgi:hypothetical protein